MFKNSAVQVKLVKTNTPANADEMDGAFEMCSSEIFNTIIKEHVKRAALTFVAAYAMCKALDTASQIAINICPKK